MNLIEAILLGFIQGITEFLPISSSGHLVIGNYFLGIENNNILFEVFVHLGTLSAIIFYYKIELSKMLNGIVVKEKESLHYFRLIIIATIPAVLAGLFFNDQIKSFYNIESVSICFLITGCILFLSKFYNKADKSITYLFAFLIGIAQAFAILPGISRSGVTIGIALLIGIHNKEASKFSFILAIPVITGAVILELFKSDIYTMELINLISGFFIAAITGYFSIMWLIKLIDKLHFWKFSFYVWILSFIINYYV